MLDVNASESQCRREFETRRRGRVCQSEVRLTATTDLSLLHSTSLSASPDSLVVSPAYTLFLFPSVFFPPLEIVVYFDSQTLPLSRDITLQIYSTYFYQPQNARRQGKQGSESLGFNLLPPQPPPASLSLSQSHSLPSAHLKCTVSQRWWVGFLMHSKLFAFSLWVCVFSCSSPEDRLACTCMSWNSD